MEISRVGLIAIVINNRECSAQKVNEIISTFGHVIVGRLGIPYEKRNIFLVTLIVDGTTDEIGSLTGKLGMLGGVSVKSNLVEVSKSVCKS
ncbi:MAG: iron-only hydrogenase system regulator [Caldisericia bacterium]|nr:iron-only hydrogenase system regulator [Caldisericia bacterium]